MNCSYLLKMSDGLPRSCHELNENLLAEASDSEVELVVCNCKMMPHGLSSPTGPPDPVTLGIVVLQRNLVCPEVCPSFMGFV